jgi:superfamily II DNA or RNA helicase
VSLGLRPYQAEAIDRVRASLALGSRRNLLVLCTGGGKTITAGTYAAARAASGRRVLWVAHRSELIDQAAGALRKLTGAPESVGVVCASSQEDENPHAPVVVASVQTLAARGIYPDADLVIPDESHHAKSATWQALLTLKYPDAEVLGLTATPERSDGAALGDIFQRLIVGATVEQLTALGHLVPCRILESETPKGKRPPIVEHYLAEAKHRGPTIVFVNGIEEVDRVAEEFRAAGVEAAGVHSMIDRFAALGAFKSGRIRVLVNDSILTEGFDHPPCDTVILGRRFDHAGGYFQAVGRVLRSSPGKLDALVIDLCGSAVVHGHPSEPQIYSLEGVGMRARSSVAYCEVCGEIRTPGQDCAACGWSCKSSKQPKDLAAFKRATELRGRLEQTRPERIKRLAYLFRSRKVSNPRGWFYQALAIFASEYKARPSSELIREAQALAERRGAA